MGCKNSTSNLKNKLRVAYKSIRFGVGRFSCSNTAANTRSYLLDGGVVGYNAVPAIMPTNLSRCRWAIDCRRNYSHPAAESLAEQDAHAFLNLRG